METDNTYLGNMTTLRTPILVKQVKEEDKKTCFFGYAKGIDKEGLFIQTTLPRALNSRFQLEFFLPGYEESIVCTVEVVWARMFIPGSFDEPGMALKFLDLDEKLAEKIDRWTKNIKRVF